MTTSVAALLVTCGVGAGACTSAPPGGAANGDGPTVVAQPDARVGAGAGGTTALPDRQEPDVAADHPVALVVPATSPPVRLSVSAARRAIAGRHPRWPRVVVAASLEVAGASSAVTRRPAGEVIRAVQRRVAPLGVVPAGAVRPTVQTVQVRGLDPVREPRRYPLTTPGAAPPRPVRLTVVGDLMLTRGVRDPAAALRPMSARLRAADLTVGNLESTLSRAGAPTQGSDSFGADPTLVPLLRRAGFDALSLANNHSGDFGDRALVETVRRLERGGLGPFGAGRDLDAAQRPMVLESRGTRFAFLGFNAIGETPEATASSPGALSVSMPPRTGPLDRDELRRVTALVRRTAQRVDVVVVLPHWGTQYTHRPEPVQRRVARRLALAGADLVVGGHPHWVQGLERHAGAVVAHSLGNFVFDMDFMSQTMEGVVLEATFWGSRLMTVDLVPYRLDARFAPRLAGPREARRILQAVWATSRGPFRGS